MGTPEQMKKLWDTIKKHHIRSGAPTVPESQLHAWLARELEKAQAFDELTQILKRYV